MSDDDSSKNGKDESGSSITIEISDSISVVIAKNIWKNKDRLDIRTYVKTENYTGPTKKGISVPFEKIDKIISALKEIKELKNNVPEMKSNELRELTKSEKELLSD